MLITPHQYLIASNFFLSFFLSVLETLTMNHHNSIAVKRRKDLYKHFNRIVTTAQLFGLLPITGYKYNQGRKIVFKWCNYRTIYCLLVIIINFIVVVTSIYEMIAFEINLYSISKYILLLH